MHMYKYADMVLDTINKLISEKNYKFITVKRICEMNGIEKENKSMRHFIWYNLGVLQKLGVIEFIEETHPKRYILPSKPIILEEITNE